MTHRLCFSLFALLLLAPSALAQTPGPPYAATVRAGSIAFVFSGDKQGIHLTSVRNALTGAEYLRPKLAQAEVKAVTDASQSAGPLSPGFTDLDASAFANPFLLTVQRKGQLVALGAATDTDILRWSGTDERLHVQFQFRGLLVSGDLSVTAGHSHAFWECTLRNDGMDPLNATMYFPAFARVVVASPAADRALLPQGGGVALLQPLRQSARLEYGASLAAPFIFYDGGDQGIYLVDNNRADLAANPGACYRRYVVASGISPADARAVGPVVGIANELRLEPGASLTIGPVLVGAYTGGWDKAAALVRELRGRVLRSHQPPGWLETSPLLATATAPATDAAASLQATGAKAVVLSGYGGSEVGDYRAGPAVGGPAGLKQAVERVHALGGRVLLRVSAMLVSRKSELGSAGKLDEMALRGVDGALVEPQPGVLAMCPADPQWQDWLADTCARLVRANGADGLVLDGLGSALAQPCYSRAHHHPTPYVWNWGVHRLLRRVRERLNQVNPDAVLLVDGCVDLAREYADGFLLSPTTGQLPNEPVLRAAYPDVNAFLVVPAAPSEAVDRSVAAAAASGLRLAVDGGSSVAAEACKRLSRYLAALPEITSGVLAAADAENPPQPAVAACLFVERRAVLVVANMGDEPYDGTVALPQGFVALEDPLSGLRVEPDASGRFPITVVPRRAAAWVATERGG